MLILFELLQMFLKWHAPHEQAHEPWPLKGE